MLFFAELWNQMTNYGIKMANYGVLWRTMVSYGEQKYPMANHGILWRAMVSYGELHGSQW